jgi:hypothetical protein
LGSRIRTRWMLEPWDNNALRSFLDHALEAAGAPLLMTEGLKTTLVEHAGGNLRILCGMGDELLHAAAQRQLKRLEESLYLELYARTEPERPRRTRRSAP